MQNTLSAIGLILVFSSSSASAQNVFSLFGQGSETKTHAGSGLLASTGAPANFYNPANLLASDALEPYVSLDIAMLSYEYTYPGYETVATNRTVPLPFFGFTYKPGKTIGLAISLLPLPGSSGTTEILGLPTRRLTEDQPIVVDAETGGNGFGYQLSLGAAYRVVSGFDLGLSLLLSAGGSKATISDTESGVAIAETETKSSSYRFILGTNGQLWKGKVKTAFAIVLPSSTTTTGETVIPFLKDDDGNPASVDNSGTTKGPLEIGGGVAVKLGQWRPYVEWRHEFWGALRSQEGVAGTKKVEVDYFDTDDIGFGVDFGAQHIFTGAIGIYQSHLGEGIIADKSEDGVELLGMEFQNLDALPYYIVAFGYRFPLENLGKFQTGFSYLSGSRDVSENAIGYGSYEIQLMQFMFGSTFAI